MSKLLFLFLGYNFTSLEFIMIMYINIKHEFDIKHIDVDIILHTLFLF